MAQKLYVGNLPYNATNESLLEAFSQSQAGKVVSASVVMDRETGRSRGFGFVEMDTPEATAEAIKTWNGKELDGRALVVNEARPREERPANSFRRPANFGGYDPRR